MKQNVIIVNLDKFKARPYQVPVFEALEKRKYKRLVAVWPRRSGKDVVGYNLMLRAALRRIGTYYYVFPSYSSGRKILWDAITNTGDRILDYLPSELIESKNEMMMRIRLMNGSVIQIIGSDNFDNSIVGTNPVGMVFSEYSLQDERAYSMSKPILAANGGWALFLSTPRGKNHLYSLFEIAQANPTIWYSSILTVKDTKHIDEAEIQADIDRGEISYDLAQQEYYCSFSMGISGAVYGAALDRMKAHEQIGNVPWQSNHKVHVSYDIGNDGTALIFFQCIGQVVNLIDAYQNSGEQIEFYVNIINSKPYTYGKHFFPHDFRVVEWAGKKFTRLEKARQLGIKGEIVDSVSIEDGIEYVKSSMSKMWIDAKKCEGLIVALENYRYEYDRKKGQYKNAPLHDKHSHFCFEGSMLVRTENGDIPIKDIKLGMLVQTPLGLRKVTHVHKRLTNDLCRIQVGSTKIITTPNHSIFTQRGLIRSDDLCYTDYMEPYSYIRIKLWQKIYGSFSKVSDLKGFKKIILSHKMKRKSCLMDSFLEQISLIGLVFLVRIYLIVTSMLSRKHVVKNVQSYQCEEPLEVYDLTVEEDNCYYVNGYLVSNSDSLRYLCLSLPKTADGLTQEDIDKQRAQALYGNNDKKSSFFADDQPWHNESSVFGSGFTK